MRAPVPSLLFLLACWPPGPAAAGELGLPNRQLVLDGALESIEYLEEMLTYLEDLDPRDQPPLATLVALGALQQVAAEQTDLVADAVADDPELGPTEDGEAALGYLQDGLDQLTGIDLLLDALQPPTVRRLEEAIQDAIDLHVASLAAVQGRPARFPDGRRFDDETRPYLPKLGFLLERLMDNGVLFDRTALLETFVAKGKPIAAALRIGLVPDDGVKFDFKGGALRLRARSRVVFTGGIAAGFQLPDQFSLFASYQLPDKLSKQKLAALVGYSAGLYFASAAGASPAASFVIEHQTSEQGFAQSFVAEGTTILETFPHASVSLDRRLVTFAVKDADSLRLGMLYREGATEILVARDVPYVGALPFFSFYFRNGTRKTTIEIDNLLIFFQPYTIVAPEL